MLGEYTLYVFIYRDQETMTSHLIETYLFHSYGMILIALHSIGDSNLVVTMVSLSEFAG